MSIENKAKEEAGKKEPSWMLQDRDKPRAGDIFSGYSMSIYSDESPEGDRMPAMACATTSKKCLSRARLIAASPDLYEACKAVRLAGIPDGDIYKLVCDAVKKAEGKV